MIICHGKGNPETDGCCWVNGAICPLRWKVIDGTVYDHQGNTVGPITNVVTGPKSKRDRVAEQLTGVSIVCSVAARLIGDDPNLLNSRPALNAAWNTHPEYVAQVRPHWADIEQQLSLPAGSYQCSTWQGTGGDQCCFAEDETTNTSKRQNLTTSAVQIRQAGGKT